MKKINFNKSWLVYGGVGVIGILSLLYFAYKKSKTASMGSDYVEPSNISSALHETHEAIMNVGVHDLMDTGGFHGIDSSWIVDL